MFVSFFSCLLFDIPIFLETWVALGFIIFSIITKEFVRLFYFNKGNLTLLIFLTFYLILVIAEPLYSIISSGDISYEHKFGYYNNDSFIIVGISHSLFLLSILIFNLKLSNEKNSLTVIPPPKVSSKLFFFFFFLFILGLIPYLKDGLQGFLNLILSSRANGNSQFENTGIGNSNLLIHLSTILISVGTLSAFYLIHSLKGRIHKYILWTIFAISLLIIGSSGTRTRVILLLVPLISYILFLKKNLIIDISNRKILFFCIAGIVLLSLMVEFRNVGFDTLTTSEISQPKFDGLDLNNEFVYIVDNFQDPVNGRSLFETILLPIPEQVFKFITNPIPRIIYPDKYLDPSFAVFNMKRIGYTGLDETFNITPTIFGRFYLLYGFVGIIYLSLVTGWILRVLENKINKSENAYSLILHFSFLAFLCQSLRDLSPGWIYSFVFLYLIIYLIKKARVA